MPNCAMYQEVHRFQHKEGGKRSCIDFRKEGRQGGRRGGREEGRICFSLQFSDHIRWGPAFTAAEVWDPWLVSVLSLYLTLQLQQKQSPIWSGLTICKSLMSRGNSRKWWLCCRASAGLYPGISSWGQPRGKCSLQAGLEVTSFVDLVTSVHSPSSLYTTCDSSLGNNFVDFVVKLDSFGYWGSESMTIWIVRLILDSMQSVAWQTCWQGS